MSSNLRTLYTLFSGIAAEPFMNWEVNFHLGALWSVAGVCGILCLRTTDARALSALIVFSILFALGSATPFHELCFHLLPGAKLFRIPSRFMLWSGVGLLILAAVWISRCMDNSKSNRAWYVGLAVISPFLCHAILLFTKYEGLPQVNSLAPIFFGIAAAIVVTLNRYARSISHSAVVAILLTASALEMIPYARHMHAAFVATHPQHGREHAGVTEVRKFMAAGRLSATAPPRVLLPVNVFPPNSGMHLGLAEINANTPLFLDRPWRYLHAVSGRKEHPFINHTLPPSIATLSPGDLPYVSLDIGTHHGSGEMFVITNPFPRVYFTSATYTVSDSDKAMAAILAGAPGGPLAVIERPWLLSTNTVASRPIITAYSHSSIEIGLTNMTSGFLVLNEAWFPGWVAVRDGIEIQTEPVNLWMRAVELPAGDSLIVFQFRPRKLGLGIFISIVTLILAAAATFRWRGRESFPTQAVA